MGNNVGVPNMDDVYVHRLTSIAALAGRPVLRLFQVLPVVLERPYPSEAAIPANLSLPREVSVLPVCCQPMDCKHTAQTSQLQDSFVSRPLKDVEYTQ
jgi:hypothetical protein